MKSKVLPVAKWICIVVILWSLFNLVWLGIEVASIPEPLQIEQQTISFEPRLAKIVDVQWTRPGSVPTETDIAAFEKLLSDMQSVDYAQIAAEAARVEALEAKSLKVWDARLKRSANLCNWLEPRIGRAMAAAIVGLDPSTCAARYLSDRLRERHYQLVNQLWLRASARYHFAMALHLKGENQLAILQLVVIMEDMPGYATSNDMYIIASRLNADEDWTFVTAFSKVGGNLDWLREAYDGTEELRPHPRYRLQGINYQGR